MIKLELSELELQAISTLMDAGVRHLGLPIVPAAAGLVAKFAAAEQAAEAERDAILARADPQVSQPILHPGAALMGSISSMSGARWRHADHGDDVIGAINYP